MKCLVELEVIKQIEAGILRMDDDGTTWKIKRLFRGEYCVRQEPKRTGNIQNLGYVQIGITINGKTKIAYVHRVQWVRHNGLIPDGFEINHKNGIKTDNRIENLELVTRKQNIHHAWANGLNWAGSCYGKPRPVTT